MSRLRGGIVGCGAVANLAHIPGWRSAKNTEIVAACDSNEEAAIKTAKHWGIPGIYQDFTEMLRKEKLDFIDICTPPQTHYQITIQALKAGLHVLVEKPMAFNVSQADEMITAAREHGVKICVAHSRLFSPIIQKAKKLVDKGAIGNLLMLDIHIFGASEKFLENQKHWCHNLPLPGGLFHEVASHPIYLALSFVNNIHSVKAIARKTCSFPWVRADELKVLLEGENGSCAFTVCFNSPEDLFTMDLFGTKGHIRIDHITQSMWLKRPRSTRFHDLILDRLDLMRPVITAALYSTMERFQGRQLNRLDHHLIIQRFAESLRNNSTPPVTSEDGRKTISLLEEIWKQLT